MPSKKRRSQPNYCSYIHKVMRQVHPNLHVQKKAMFEVNALVENVVKRMTEKSANIAIAGGKGTLQSRHVLAAAKLIMPHKLSKHAVSEGTKAVTKFTA